MNGFYLMPHPPIMIPEVGKGEEKKINNTVESCINIGKEIEKNNIETIIIISPHGVVFRDGIGITVEPRLCGSLRKFGVPEVNMTIEIDLELTQDIINGATENGIAMAPLNKEVAPLYGIELELDHGTIVPFYYIFNSKQYKIVHIAYGLLAPMELYKFGMCIRDAVNTSNKRCVIIASGDLSHRLKNEGPYDYSPYGKKFDENIMEILSNGNIRGLMNLSGPLVSEAGECGLRSLYIMAGAMDGLKVKGNVLSYEDTFGVGYGVVNFSYEKGESLYNKIIEESLEENNRRMVEGNTYTRLARKNLNYYFDNSKPIELSEDLEKELLNNKKGVFVSLKEHGELRGCIGTIQAVTSCIGEEIIRNSISAATEDPRFPKVNKEELPYIDISVDILYEAQRCNKEDLDPKNYGVIVTSGQRRGLLLPNLEGINTIDEQLSIALKKGDIYPSENYYIERFKVERYSEVEDDE